MLGRKKKKEPAQGFDEITPLEPEQPSGNGDGFKPEEIPPELAEFLDSGVRKPYDVTEMARMIAEPDGEQAHVMSEILPHQVVQMIRMDYDDYLMNDDDLRTPQQVIRDSYCKWMRARNRELIKDLHKLVANYPREEDKDTGSSFLR